MRSLMLAMVLVLSASVGHAAELTVSVAASLKDAFAEIAKAFEVDQPAHRVLLNAGASGQLLQQIAKGAPVDVFASADEETMDRAQEQNLIVKDTRADFARNRLVVVVPADARFVPRTLKELGGAEVQRIAIGNPESVPAGRYAKGALVTTGLWDTVKARLINTQNVRQALDYAARGEVDAAFVYVTDAVLPGSRVKVAFEVPTASPVVYPISVVKGSASERIAAAFVQFVRGDAGRRILRKFSFELP